MIFSSLYRCQAFTYTKWHTQKNDNQKKHMDAFGHELIWNGMMVVTFAFEMLWECLV